MSRSRARVRFLPREREIVVSDGTYLTAAAIRAGVTIIHDCDGLGLCATCRVRIERGAEHLPPITPTERAQLGDAVDEGWRLCCLLRVHGDVVVRLPEPDFAYPPELQRG